MVHIHGPVISDLVSKRCKTWRVEPEGVRPLSQAKDVQDSGEPSGLVKEELDHEGRA